MRCVFVGSSDDGPGYQVRTIASCRLLGNSYLDFVEIIRAHP
jgi:hypothetical protein